MQYFCPPMTRLWRHLHVHPWIHGSEGQEKRTPRQGRSLNTSSLGCGGLLLRKRAGCSVDAGSATFYSNISWRISFLKDSESLFSRLIHLAAYPVSHWMCILQLCDSHARTSCIKQLFCNVCLMQEPMLVLVKPRMCHNICRNIPI